MRRHLIAGLVLMAALPSLATAIEVWIDEPRSTKFVFGEVEFEAKVQADERVAAVEFFLDGVKLGELVSPPYRMMVDVGYDNVEHEFRVMARTIGGETASR